MLKKELEHELGRYKKAVETRDIVINKLKEEMAGQEELMKILSAYIVYLLPKGKTFIDKKKLQKLIESEDLGLSFEETEAGYKVTRK